MINSGSLAAVPLRKPLLSESSLSLQPCPRKKPAASSGSGDPPKDLSDAGFSALAVGHPKIPLDPSSVLEQQLTTELDPSAEVRRQRLGRNLGRDSES